MPAILKNLYSHFFQAFRENYFMQTVTSEKGVGIYENQMPRELQTLHGNTVFEGVAVNVRQSGWKINLSCTRAIRKGVACKI